MTSTRPDPSPTRERHVTWHDPLALAAAARSMEGIAFLQAIQAGALPPPPIIALLGITMAAVTPGSVTMVLPAGEYLFNPIGMVHGGALATLLDSVMGCAVQSVLPPDKAYTTLEIKVNYLRAMTMKSGAATAVATVRHLGARTAVAEAQATDAQGRLLATASTTCMVMDLPAAPGKTA
ncbi:MAG: PaaI family thioesterase [Hyphomicrobiales bacterium]|nr:PaaI family thioesterase [Hyphomicrobiales bacterium]